MRRSIHTLMLTLALLLGLQSLALAATEHLDQQQTEFTHAVSVEASRWVAQTFTAGQTGALTRLSLRLSAAGAPSVTLTVHIRDVDATTGAPTGTRALDSTALATASVTVSEETGPGWVDVEFTTPAMVNAGNQYALVVGRAPSAQYAFGLWAFYPGGDDTDLYPGGRSWSCDINNCWAPRREGDDQAFKTYVTPLAEPDPTYTVSGFQAPLNPDPSVLNVAKAGQTIPLAFRVTLDGAPVSDLTMATIALTSVPMPCDGGDAGETIVASVAGKSGLQNLGDGYYQYNWATQKGWANSCRQLQLDLGDGLTHTANFQFKK